MNSDFGCVICFNSLGVGSRMDIYKFLKKNGKRTVGEVVDHVNLTQPTVSYHLNEMKNAGILNSKRVGKRVFYTVSDHCPQYEEDCILSGVEFPENAKNK